MPATSSPVMGTIVAASSNDAVSNPQVYPNASLRLGSLKSTVLGRDRSIVCVCRVEAPARRGRCLVRAPRQWLERVPAVGVARGRREDRPTQRDGGVCHGPAVGVEHTARDCVRGVRLDAEVGAVLNAVVPREDELAARASPLLERLPRERVAARCRVIGEPGVARCLRRDRQWPRSDEFRPRCLGAQRGAVDLPGVRGVLARMSRPRSPPASNSIFTADPRSTVLSAGPGAMPPKKPSRHSGSVSNASLLSSRPVVPWRALKPRPRRANVAQTVQVSSPPSASVAPTIASRATTNPGAQPWNLSPSITYWSARLLPPEFQAP